MNKMASNDKTPLIGGKGGSNLRKRSHKPKDESRWERPPGEDWDPTLPYGGKVFLARMKKPDPWWVTALEILAILFAVSLAYYAYYYFDHLHYHVTRGYAHLGYSDAQHIVGQRLLFGKGVDKDPHHAMEWFKKAADQGHPHASYNLALGHIKGIRTDLLQQGESHRLMAHAASQGVPDARLALQELCSKGKCT